jgi:hypothetical protein
MAQADASLRAVPGSRPVKPCGIYGGQSGTETGLCPSSSASPVNIFLPWLSILIYHMEDEQ